MIGSEKMSSQLNIKCNINFSHSRSFFAKVYSGYVKFRSVSTSIGKPEGDDAMLIALYVDDLPQAGNSRSTLQREQKTLQQRFEMKELG